MKQAGIQYRIRNDFNEKKTVVKMAKKREKGNEKGKTTRKSNNRKKKPRVSNSCGIKASFQLIHWSGARIVMRMEVKERRKEDEEEEEGEEKVKRRGRKQKRCGE